MGVILIRLLFLGVGLVATACGTDPSGPAAGSNPSIAIDLSANSLSVEEGDTGSITAAVTRSGGFTGPVNLQTVGVPTGITAYVAHITTSGTRTTGTVRIAVAHPYLARTYDFTVRASGPGVLDVVSPVSLDVTRAPSIGLDYSEYVTVSAGQNGTVQITISRVGFTGNVTLALEGAPTGVTGTFAPNATATNASTLTIGVGSGVPTGYTYELTVRATATGVFDSYYTLVLTVSRP